MANTMTDELTEVIAYLRRLRSQAMTKVELIDRALQALEEYEKWR